jgi:outer membrane immunogenic protein
MLKKLLFAMSVPVLTICNAQADTMEPVAFDWTGPYVGLQAGYGWNELDVNVDRLAGTARIDADTFERDGFIGGLYAGYLFQEGRLVFGLEGDIEYSDMKGQTDLMIEFTDEGDIESTIDWLGSLRLRAGFAKDRALIYATGGLAIGGVELEADNLNPVLRDDPDKTAKLGWTVGGGLEYAVADDLSVRFEYRYTDLGDTEGRISIPASPFFDYKVHTDFHAIRGGVSWRF